MLLKVAEVSDLVKLARPTIYRMMAAGKFPRPVKLGARAVRWRRADVETWIEERPLACEDSRAEQ